MGKYIVNAKYPWDGISESVSEDMSILVEDGKIASVGKREDIIGSNPSADVICGKDYLVMPSFVNAHDHGRGVSPVAFGAFDRALEMWLQDLNKLPYAFLIMKHAIMMG